MSVSLVLIAATSAFSLPALSDPPLKGILPPKAIVPTQTKKGSAVQDFGSLPLSFESNQGQTDAKVRFLTHSGDSTLFLTPTEAVFSMSDQAHIPQKEKSSLLQRLQAYRSAKKISRVALRMQMVGADPEATILEQQPLAGRINYFIGKNPSKWHAGVPTFGRVGFHGVYPGVDLVYYGNQRHLEYDFVVAPHADPKQIHLHFAGARHVQVNAAGDLIVHAKGRELRWQKPTVYQQDANGKRSVAAHFLLNRLPNGKTGVRFALGRYDSGRSLIIDPVLLYSTLLGAKTDSTVSNSGNSIAVDSSGNAYIGGFAGSSDFPTTSGAYQETDPAVSAAFVTKIDPTGTRLVYSTFLGGASGGGAHLSGLALDSNGNAYVTGQTLSTDFPTTVGAFQRVNNGTQGACGFVTKIDPTGSTLVYSTFLGGSRLDLPRGIAVDNNGSAYVVGRADSSNFPTTPGAFQTVYKSQGNGNAFVTKFNSTGTALVYSTYLGGSGSTGGSDPHTNEDDAYTVAVDSVGNAYITGITSSFDFPITLGVFQTVNHRKSGVLAYNGFVTKLNSTGSSLVYSTFIGGSGIDGSYGIAIDSAGNAFISGSTTSQDFPTTPGAFQTTPSSGGMGFVAKLNPTATGLIYSTFLGGSGGTVFGVIPISITVDSGDDACVTGYTDASDFMTTVGAFQRTKAPSSQPVGFVTKLNAAGTALLYSTYLGGSGGSTYGDGALGIALDNQGNAYIVGGTSSIDFPTTPGAFQTTNHATAVGSSAFVTKLSPVPIYPDFNNDGYTDLLIQNSTTNVIASWFMNGSSWTGGAYFSLTPPTEYALVGVGDFSGNGATTLVLQSRTTNQIAFWYTSGANNATIPGGNFVNTTPPAGWKVVGVGDFNGDGKSDLVFQNQATNQVAIWFMNGYLYQGGVLMPFTPPTGWTVAGVGDFNADGFPDIAFQNQTTGQIVLWYMNNSTYIGGTLLTTVPASGWKVVGVGDYNGDGSADLLFQNQTSNQAAVWYLTNGAFVGGDVLSLAPPTGWKIVGPR
ncbi:MAG: hypothetical protein JWL77_1079 [Chthonomonadaceae bacterium]|nr:hypothetical protein [Chthonomonadaceae bacterium]